jgi:hypothetical protein
MDVHSSYDSTDLGRLINIQDLLRFTYELKVKSFRMQVKFSLVTVFAILCLLCCRGIKV